MTAKQTQWEKQVNLTEKKDCASFIEMADANMADVVFFDQPTGAPHAVHWFNTKTTFCILFSRKMYKITQKMTKSHD